MPDLATSSSDEVRLETPVTTVIRHQPRPDAAARYEEWLKEIIPVARTFAGHQSVDVIRPHAGSDYYTVVLHFDTIGHLRQWLDSETRVRLVDKIRPYLRAQEDIDVKTGIEFWFTPPPGGKHAKPWKQFLVTLSAIFPLTMFVPWFLQPAFQAIPLFGLPGVRHLIIAAAIVGLIIYVIMPRYTRLVAHWLYSDGDR